MGPVVGRRTWGGTIGCDSYSLVDDTEVTMPMTGWFAAPRAAADLRGSAFSIENRGVEPDVEVVYGPDDYLAGKDPQLTKAVELAMARLDAGEVIWRPEGLSNRPPTTV